MEANLVKTRFGAALRAGGRHARPRPILKKGTGTSRTLFSVSGTVPASEPVPFFTIADAVGLASDFIADDIRDWRAEEEAGDRGAWLDIEIDEETAASFKEKISLGELRRYARLQIEKERKSLLDHLNAVPGKHRGQSPPPG